MKPWFVPGAVLGSCVCWPVAFDEFDSTSSDTTTSPPPDRGTGDTAGVDTAPCPDGVHDGPTMVVDVDIICTIGGTGRSSTELAGWAADGSGALFWQGTGTESHVGWSEEHPMDRWYRDPCGFAERHNQSLVKLGVGADAWRPGLSSVFTCEDLGPPLHVTAALYVEDVDDGSPHCVVVGHDPQGLIDGDYDGQRMGADPSFDLSLCTVMSGDEK